MRLISARIRGFGRLADVKINLDPRVIAIVGPNEAGKTTLLKALAYVDGAEALPFAHRSRAVVVTDDTPVTELTFILDESDLAALSSLNLQNAPARVTISLSASARTRAVGITPIPLKSVATLESCILPLSSARLSEELDEWIDPQTTYSDPASDAARDYRHELEVVIDAIERALENPGTEISAESVGYATSLLTATLDEPGAANLRSALQSVISWHNVEDPAGEARTILWKRSPDIILFNDAERSIQSTYTLNAGLVANPPSALRNLATTAGLDLAEVLTFIQSGDIARRRTAIVRANRRMDVIFAEAWKQSHLSVHLEIEGDQLRIELTENDDTVTVFDERSAGLRMFVALVAFLKVHGSSRPPILLIDEAENHLHIDAQADLVNMFVTQKQAAKVVYTTHSPACLPPDLGAGIRSVVPRVGNLQISDVRNSFWQGAVGYSPLMLVMGAAAAAFTPVRQVVLAEGATEMILLPTLIRAATGQADLQYQVAPGLSEAPRELLASLDLEAARVMYLVDGDNGGRQLMNRLVDAGIPQKLIVELGVAGVENLLDQSAYREAVEALLRECNPEVDPNSIASLPELTSSSDGPWATKVARWISTQQLAPPSKVAVASWLVGNGKALLSDTGRQQLQRVHDSFVSVFH